jgi:exoribonuclease-2
MSRRQRHDLKGIAHQAMRARGLWPDFAHEVLEQVDRVAGREPRTGGARDLRELPWLSIDNDDSRDLDQLSAAEPAAAGTTTLRVAIADVATRVLRDTAIDRHAAHNTTSVYTVAEIFPMLPVRLSTDLTSLNEHEERLALVVEMRVHEDGRLAGSDVYQARVVNHAKLAYPGVAAWLEGHGPPPPPVAAQPELAAQLRAQDRVAQALRRLRHEQGALELETIEPRPVFSDGELTDLRVEEKNRARELIEDLMIAANGVTARFRAARGQPSIRRVLRSPERWERIVEVAAKLHEELPPAPDAGALEAFLARRRRADARTFPDLSLTIVKLMGRGEYEVELPGRGGPGHFGLAVQDYAHSTAPNRRFPDLVTQRLLLAALAGAPAPYDAGQLAELARHCTEQENNANKVERHVRKSAAALLLESRIGARFDAIVTGASDKGTWARISKPAVEGRVVRGQAGLDVGETVRVELVHVDVERGFIDFAAS